MLEYYLIKKSDWWNSFTSRMIVTFPEDQEMSVFLVIEMKSMGVILNYLVSLTKIAAVLSENSTVVN